MKFISSIFFVSLIAFGEDTAQKNKIYLESSNFQCVQIYYDRSSQPNYEMGRTYSIFLQNLLGHFPEYQQIVSPIESYREGDLNNCKANFYLASYFENKIPLTFIKDFENTKSNVVWLGYSIWRPSSDWFEKIFGYRYERLTKLDSEHLDSKGRPTFFKNVSYKNKIFRKYGEWSLKKPQQFMAQYEIVALRPTALTEWKYIQAKTEILAEISHNYTNEKLPYILRNKNRFYVADIPFSFIHEADRYLIFADLLFDVLESPARHTNHPALMRLEDVHPMIELPYVYDAIDALKKEKIPIHLSLIPIFYDPFHVYERGNREFVSLEDSLLFMNFINEIKSKKGNFIWHGVTHQNKKIRNPHSGLSGDDFEFWDASQQQPLSHDNSQWVLERLYDGAQTLAKGGIDYIGWLTPHYQASALDSLLFARVFPWNFGRIIYFDFTTEGFELSLRDPAWVFQIISPINLAWKDQFLSSRALQEKRLRDFSTLKVQTKGKWNGQFFPYEIYGDIYGQKIIPENLGNNQAFQSEQVPWTRSSEDILEDADRNSVLRDSWASFFYHPQLLKAIGPSTGSGLGAFPGDSADLVKLLQGLKQMKYQFIDVKEFMQNHQRLLRPEPIYRE